jgi:hypothetical protein
MLPTGAPEAQLCAYGSRNSVPTSLLLLLVVFLCPLPCNTVPTYVSLGANTACQGTSLTSCTGNGVPSNYYNAYSTCARSCSGCTGCTGFTIDGSFACNLKSVTGTTFSNQWTCYNLTFICCSGAGCTGGVSNDAATCAALGDLYNAAKGAGVGYGAAWTNTSGWASAAAGNATDYCTFRGSFCDSTGALTFLCVPATCCLIEPPACISHITTGLHMQKPQ